MVTFKREIVLSDGLRVANANNAPTGEIRFAGANATGFTTTTLYSAEFVVKTAGYAGKLTLQMQELSAARSLQNLTSQLRMAPQVYQAPATVRLERTGDLFSYQTYGVTPDVLTASPNMASLITAVADYFELTR